MILAYWQKSLHLRGLDCIKYFLLLPSKPALHPPETAFSLCAGITGTGGQVAVKPDEQRNR